MATLVIGDIHGCWEELQALLDKAGIGDDDAILAVGDIVDRGPETPQVLDFFQSRPKAITTLGNHERKHVRAGRGEIQLSVSQRISQIQLGDVYHESVQWMNSLPLFLDLPEATLVHGYLEPGLSLSEQNPLIVCGTMGGERILRNRYNSPWYELYDGDRPVVVGHCNYNDSDRPFIYHDKVFGLDTSCVMGKSLSGLLLPSFQILSIPSRGDLWERVRKTYQPPKKPESVKIVNPWSDQDNIALTKLVDKTRTISEAILASLCFSRHYNQLTSRQQAKLYADRVGSGPASVLLQMARVGNLDFEAARKIVRRPKRLDSIADQMDALRPVDEGE
jgi:serine/threonine protein phosphatase 1